MTAVVGLR